MSIQFANLILLLLDSEVSFEGEGDVPQGVVTWSKEVVQVPASTQRPLPCMYPACSRPPNTEWHRRRGGIASQY